MLPWKLRKRQILPVSQNLSSVYFSLAKFQLVSCNLSLAMIWQITYTHKLPKLCSATLNMWYLPDWTGILEKLRCDSKLYLWEYLSSWDWLTCFWAVTLLAAFCHCFLEPCSTDITDCSSSAFCSLSTKIRQKKKKYFIILGPSRSWQVCPTSPVKFVARIRSIPSLLRSPNSHRIFPSCCIYNS